MISDVQMFKVENSEALSHHRTRRSYQPDMIYIDASGQPREIPNEFKARNEIAAGFESIFP